MYSRGDSEPRSFSAIGNRPRVDPGKYGDKAGPAGTREAQDGRTHGQIVACLTLLQQSDRRCLVLHSCRGRCRNRFSCCSCRSGQLPLHDVVSRTRSLPARFLPQQLLLGRLQSAGLAVDVRRCRVTGGVVSGRLISLGGFGRLHGGGAPVPGLSVRALLGTVD